MWKQRITMFLKYRECEVVTTRVKTETDSEDWDKKDPKAINIIYTAITNRPLEYIREEKTAYEKVKNIVRASVSNGHASSSEVSYKCINEVKIKFLFFLISFFLFYVTLAAFPYN